MSELMYNIIVISAFALIMGGIGAGVTILFFKMSKKEFFKEPLKKTVMNIRESSEYDAEIAKSLCRIKNIAEADKVTLCRFHNGGVYCNGLPMKRYTVTHETPFGSNEPLHDSQSGVLVSKYPTAMVTLATYGFWIVHDIQDCTCFNFKKDMERFGFKATYLLLIRNYDGSEEGFIGLNWKYSHVVPEDKYQEVKQELPNLLGLMNLKKERAHNKDVKCIV